MKKLIILLILGAVYFGMNCPIDGSTMLWTGKTEIEWGKLLKEYRCVMGHYSWYPG